MKKNKTKKNVDNGHSQQKNGPRHKCSGCGKVRFEKFMKKYSTSFRKNIKTRYGNIMWICKDDLECEELVNLY